MNAHAGHAGGRRRCLFGAPVFLVERGQLVMTERRLRMHDGAETLAADQLCDTLHRRFKAPFMANCQHTARIGTGRNNAARAGRCQRQRLFAEHMLSCLCGGYSLFFM